MMRSDMPRLLLRLAVAIVLVQGGKTFVHAADAVADSASADSGAARADSTAAGPDSSHAAARADTAKGATTAKPEHKGNAALGKKIFAVKCVACHKPNGSGGVKITGNPTPDWRDAKRMNDGKHDDAYLRDCITNGKPKSGMPTWSKQGVKPADIENLIAYIRTFSAPKP